MDRTSMTLIANTIYFAYVATHWGDCWACLRILMELFQ